VLTKGFELGPPVQVTSTVTTTPLRMTLIAADNNITFNWIFLLAFRSGLGSNLLGSPFKISNQIIIFTSKAVH
jgi:hypothetical protein